MNRRVCFLWIAIAFCWCSTSGVAQTDPENQSNSRIQVESIPQLPDDIGVAGPIVGLHNDAIIVAGGANFARPDDPNLWTLPKKYHRQGWVLIRDGDSFQWDAEQSFELSQPIGYPAVVSSDIGVIVMGGHDADQATNRAFLLRREQTSAGVWQVVEDDAAVPDLPIACTEGAAAILTHGKQKYVYLFAGNVYAKPYIRGQRLEPSRTVWRIAIGDLGSKTSATWEQIPDFPETASARAHSLVAAQHDGFNDRLYLIGGRRFAEGSDTSDLNNLNFLNDVWSFNPAKYDKVLFDFKTGAYYGESPWQRAADAPKSFSAGTAVPYGPSHIVVLGYADGTVIRQFLDAQASAKRNGNDEFDWKDFDHPGFPKTAYAYHTVTDTWVNIGEMPVNQVTTPAVKQGNDIFIVSGEVRPRVRSNEVWKITIPVKKNVFGSVNMSVLVIYLLAIVGVGIFFTLRNKNTDDYFRGGKSIHWFVAGCSIYATMLSSITYMAIPAKAFAQDWVYGFGMFLILAVAPIAIYVALPFFRRIDATSAYEYLEQRFNRTVRWVGSASFTIFHVFRMGVVMALAALALASVTPLTPTSCVIVMGVLAIIYCTLGGIEAVVWTDTVQTFVLLGGALFCIVFAWLGSDSGSVQAAADAGKFHLVNFDLNPAHFTTMTLLVVIVGGFGQNVASYTADQAVVQRYMTTADSQKAARSIWFNGLMAIPSGIIFFGLGTAFWMFYRSHPEKLDPAIASDRIMPLFISQELPIGIAGLVVAGIFAAAQSTVSTSMNSGATTIVTDFLKPLRVFGNVGSDDSKQNQAADKKYLYAARVITLLMGVLGTAAGLLFVNPDIKSLFDEFIGILGIFLGVLAGLFVLGATTRCANGWGGLIGAIFSLLVMSLIFLASKDATIVGVKFLPLAESILPFQLYQMSGYLYAFFGIVLCYVVGYLSSLLIPVKPKSIEGLTLYSK